MAQIELRLSSKVQKETKMCEVLIRFFQGTKFNTRAKSGIYISPEYFEYYIDRAKTEKNDVKVPANLATATLEKADKNNYVLRQSGLIVIKQRLETPDVKYHREQANRSRAIFVQRSPITRTSFSTSTPSPERTSRTSSNIFVMNTACHRRIPICISSC